MYRADHAAGISHRSSSGRATSSPSTTPTGDKDAGEPQQPQQVQRSTLRNMPSEDLAGLESEQLRKLTASSSSDKDKIYEVLLRQELESYVRLTASALCLADEETSDVDDVDDEVDLVEGDEDEECRVLVKVPSKKTLPPIAATASAQSAAAAYNASKIRVGIIGCGRIGQVHANNIATRVPNATLVAVSDFIDEAAERVAKRFSVPIWYRTAEDLVRDPRVDAVVICSPTETHAPLMMECARYGKHIFCEKPIALDLAKIDEALGTIARVNEEIRGLKRTPASPRTMKDSDLSGDREEDDLYRLVLTEHHRRLRRLRQQKRGVQLMVAFQRRYDVNFSRARQAHESGFLGRPLKLHLVSRDPAPPPVAYLKSSGGIWLDQAIHDFDMARFLLKSEPVEVYATGFALDPEIRDIGDVDHALTQLRFANGAMCVIDNSRATPHQAYDQRAELFGANGTITVGNEQPNTTEFMDKLGVHKDKPLNFFMERYAEAYLQEMMAWVASLVETRHHATEEHASATSQQQQAAADGGAVLLPQECPGGFDGRISVVIAMAARKSYEEKRPVRLTEIDPSLEEFIADAERAAA